MYKHFFKPLFDFILSFIGIIVLIPVWIILLLAILIDDPGPIFFTQKRVGIHKKFFKEHKNITDYKPFTEKEIKVA